MRLPELYYVAITLRSCFKLVNITLQFNLCAYVFHVSIGECSGFWGPGTSAEQCFT